MAYKFWAALLVACLTSEIVSAATDKVVCYHGSWSVYRSGNGNFGTSNIDPSLCTHVIYSFVGINADGSIAILDTNLEVNRGNLAAFVSLKSENPKLKTLVAVGGWSEGSLKYSTMAADATTRATFIESALNLVQNYGLDGFDIDWEYPALRGGAAADKANFATLLKEMREVWDQHEGLLLTAAVAATQSMVDTAYDVPALSKYLDFINVMAYDLHGSWDGVTGQNAPLYASSIDTTDASKFLNVDSTIQGWLERGADPQKLVLGIGTYGRTFTLSSTSNTALGAPVTGAGTSGPYTLEPGMMGYHEICEKQLAGGWTTEWDEEQQNPYTYNGDQWIGYDNVKSVTVKANYAKSLNLAGVMIWSIEMDDFAGTCGTKYPLLTALNDALETNTTSETVVEEIIEAIEEAVEEAVESIVEEVAEVNAEIEDKIKEESSNSDDSSSADSSSSVVTCTSAGYIRDPTDCSIYYRCIANAGSYTAVKKSCPAGLYFDQTYHVCNWAILVSGCS